MSKQHELTEGQLASLGTVLVLLEMIGHRIDVAIQRSTMGAVLEPAHDDLAQADTLIRNVQRSLASSLYQSRALMGCECSSKEIHEVPRKPIAPGLGRTGRRKTLASDN